MATIPLYDKRMSPSGATARVEARPVLGSMDAAAAPYRALSQVGEAVSGIGQQMGAYAQRKQQAQIEMEKADRQNAKKMVERDINLALQAANHARDQYMGDPSLMGTDEDGFTKPMSKDIMKALENPRLSKYPDLLAELRDGAVYNMQSFGIDTVAGHRAKKLEAEGVQLLNVDVESFVEAGNGDAAIARINEAEGQFITPAKAAEMRKEIPHKVDHALAKTAIANNPRDGIDLINKGKFPNLLPEDKTSLINFAKSERAARELSAAHTMISKEYKEKTPEERLAWLAGQHNDGAISTSAYNAARGRVYNPPPHEADPSAIFDMLSMQNEIFGAGTDPQKMGEVMQKINALPIPDDDRNRLSTLAFNRLDSSSKENSHQFNYANALINEIHGIKDVVPARPFAPWAFTEMRGIQDLPQELRGDMAAEIRDQLNLRAMHEVRNIVYEEVRKAEKPLSYDDLTRLVHRTYLSVADQYDIPTLPEHIRALKGEPAIPPAPTAPAPAAPSAPTPAAPVKVQTDEDFDALPPGTTFIDPEGATRIKP